MVIQHVKEGGRPSRLAAENGISLRTACRWPGPGRFRSLDLIPVDDATRLATVGNLLDEQKPTLVCRFSRAVACFNGQGIECHPVRRDTVRRDNRPAYVSKAFAKASCVLGLQHKDVVHRAARLTNLLRHNI